MTMNETMYKRKTMPSSPKSTATELFCPSLVLQLSDVLCFDSVCTPYANASDNVQDDQWKARHKYRDHSIMALSDEDDERSDPRYVLRSQIRAAADLRDDVSCDSSITSAGKSISSNNRARNHVRVSFGPQLAPKKSVPDEVCAGCGAEQMHLQILNTFSRDDEDASIHSGVKSERSTRFDDALNQTYKYVPHITAIVEAIDQEVDDDDYPDHKSEGGKVNVWRSNMEILDQHRFDYRVIGTSTHDESTKPHVLTLPVMEALQEYLPYCKRGELFWLKYSMIRDGASVQYMLNKTRGSDYTILAIETMDGEVFGAFTAQPWHIAWKYYGTNESFLWRLRKRRARKGKSTGDEEDGDLDVYRYSGMNRNIQLCNTKRLAVGGGIPSSSDADSVVSETLSHVRLMDWGFGLAFGSDLQQGTSSPCITFESPSLSEIHKDGSLFEVANLEIWTLTPCMTLADAEKMEVGKLAIDRCMTV